MSNTVPNQSASDQDLDNLMLFILFALFALLFALLLYVPLLYLVGFYVYPVKSLGAFGAILGGLIFIIPFIFLVFVKNKPPFDYPFLLIMGIAYPLLGLFVPHLFTLPLQMCQGEGFWFLNCPKPLALVAQGLSWSMMKIYLTPISPFLFWLFIITFKSLNSKNPKTQYRQNLSFESYLNLQKHIYPHLHFYTKVNPLKFNLFVGEKRIMDNAKRFVFGHFLILGFAERGKTEIETQMDNPNQTPILDDYLNELNLVPVIDIFKCNQEFLLQLGSLWVSIDDLEPLEIIVLSVLVPRLQALDPQLPDKEADKLLKQVHAFLKENWLVATQCVNENGDVIQPFDPVVVAKRQEILKQASEHFIFQDILKKHAYVRTIIYECFVQLRYLGVLQASEFSWINFFDRTLWAVINNIGSPSHYLEGVGVSNHYLLEKANDTALYGTDFTASIKSLDEQLSSYHFSPKVMQAYSHWQKTGDIEPLKQTDVFTHDDSTITGIYLNHDNMVKEQGEANLDTLFVQDESTHRQADTI